MRYLVEVHARPLRRSCDCVGLSRSAWYAPPLDWTVPECSDRIWSAAFMLDDLTCGRSFQTFNLLKEFSREAIHIIGWMTSPAPKSNLYSTENPKPAMPIHSSVEREPSAFATRLFLAGACLLAATCIGSAIADSGRSGGVVICQPSDSCARIYSGTCAGIYARNLANGTCPVQTPEDRAALDRWSREHRVEFEREASERARREREASRTQAELARKEAVLRAEMTRLNATSRDEAKVRALVDLREKAHPSAFSCREYQPRIESNAWLWFHKLEPGGDAIIRQRLERTDSLHAVQCGAFTGGDRGFSVTDFRCVGEGINADTYQSCKATIICAGKARACDPASSSAQ